MNFVKVKLENERKISLLFTTAINVIYGLNESFGFFIMFFLIIVAEYIVFSFGFKGKAGDDLKTEMMKLTTLSAAVYCDDLLMAAKTTFCFRRKKIEKLHPSYLECVQQIPCYLSLPQMVYIFMSSYIQH